MGIIKKFRSELRNEQSSFLYTINKYSKVDKCVICGKKMSSACNSHVVPRFILENIAENGRVNYGTSLIKIDIQGLNKQTGVNNAHTFKLICRECDKKLFEYYENKNNLYNFDKLDINPQSRILIEMAIKARLSHVSMKYKEMNAKNIASGGELGEKEKNGKGAFVERIDIYSHYENIKKLLYNIKNKTNPFKVLLNIELDYRAEVATQTIINFNYDLCGKKIFDYKYISYDNHLSWFYLMILPLADKTRILFYIDNDDCEYVTSLIDQFEMLTLEEKIHFLFIALLLHDEQFYISPTLSTVMTSDKRIVKLYSKSEKNLRFTREIMNFKKYNNYLLEKKN